MSDKLLMFLAAGTLLMLVPVLWVGRYYKQSVWKLVIATVLLTVTGTVGTVLMAYIEVGPDGGMSFYGAVFLVPLVFPIVAYLLYMPCAKLLDLCAMGECAMLALMRVNCLINGCCGGRVLFTLENGKEIRFPNQIAELILGLVILSVLIYLAYRKPQYHGGLYAWYLILYGSARFCLTFLREETAAWTPSERIPMAFIWSPIAVAIGITWLQLKKRRDRNKPEEPIKKKRKKQY